MRRIAILACATAVVAVASPASARTLRGPHFNRHATVYSTSACDANSPSNRTANGTLLDESTRPTVASNEFPVGTLLRFDRLVFGHRYYRVRDTGSGAYLLDVYVPCSRLNPTWSRDVGFERVQR